MESRIQFIRAADPKVVADIVEETVRMVYPKYYPKGAVQFFLDLHKEDKIRAAMHSEEIYLLIAGQNVVGTGSIRGCEICRLFILPEFQKKGYGGLLMDFLEKEVLKKSDTVYIDASFPAEGMYLHRGYQILTYETIETENKDFLCYHTMKKQKE